MNDEEFDSLDDLDFDESGLSTETPESNVEEVQLEEVKEEEQGEDMLDALLRERGIVDPTNIKFEGNDGIVRNRNWNELSAEEQYNILNQSPDADPETDLDDNEVDLINEIRRSGLSVGQYLQQYADNNAHEVEDNDPVYAVDDLTDDELFVLDLQGTSKDITDEEAYAALQNAKANPSLYEKQVQGLREEYKQLEDDRNNQIQIQKQAEEEQAFNEFAGNIGEQIQSLNSVGSLDINLEQSDKEELAEFILGRDQAGVSYFGKALNDPETLTRMAWFALYGEDTFNEINNYMSDQLKRTAQAAYERGLHEGRNGGSRVVINKAAGGNSVQHTNKSYDELDDLDY